MAMLTVPSLPAALEWRRAPLNWQVDPEGSLTITAGAETDWFFDPAGAQANDTAPGALFTPPHDTFLLSALVRAGLVSTFDAAVLQVAVRDDLWAKLCLELSPQGHPTIVSVVTRGVSDDCNSADLGGAETYLRIARLGRTFAFHYSLDGCFWHLVRYFTLGPDLAGLRVGFAAQSPTGRSCTATFSAITYRPALLADLRGGQ
jgi:regulation of enolase protein 1 (concanavalin A-like superfamily)